MTNEETAKTLPDMVREISAKAACEYDEANKAIKVAKSRVRKIENYDKMAAEWFDSFVDSFIQEAVWDARHKQNTRIKNEQGEYNTTEKVSPITSKAVAKASISAYFSLNIGGRSLGSLLGSELTVLAEQELLVAKGHSFNASLLNRLATIVPKTKTVSEAVSSKRMDSIALTVKSDLESEW